MNLAAHAVEAVPPQLRLRRVGLRGVVVCAELCDDVGRVARGVDGELLRDDEEGLRCGAGESWRVSCGRGSWGGAEGAAEAAEGGASANSAMASCSREPSVVAKFSR